MNDSNNYEPPGRDTPLAIVGIGCLFPKADGLSAYWSNIKNGADCIGPVPATHWDPADYFDADAKRPDLTYARRGGFLDPYPFNPAEFGIAPRDLEAIDTAQLLGLVAAKMALDDSGILNRNVDRNRVSVILGVTGTLELVIPLGARLGHPLWRKALREAGVADDVADRIVSRIADGYVGWQENSFPGLLGNVVAGRIANRLDLGGTNCVVDAACASSLSALHLAALELTAGRADAVLTGGVDTFNDIFMYMCFSKTPALSPTGDARPFDANADGTILGEGLGLLVLKRLADAERAGDRVYAVVRGLGTSSDGAGNAVYAPTPAGQARALRDAYARAGVSPATVELVEGHGTGTKVGDASELAALTEVFRETKGRGTWCALGSVKSQVGHTKAAAGVAGLIKAALALRHRVIPPTIKVRKPADSLAASPFYAATEKRPWLPRDNHPRRAAVSSFGFGGSNFHCVLEEHTANRPEPDWDGDVQIVALSADDESTLRANIKRLSDDPRARSGEWHDVRRLAAETRSAFDASHNCRVTLVVRRDKNDLTGQLESAERLCAGQRAQSDDVAFGRGAPSRLGFLFPGQGSQYIGMLRDLACQFPAFQDVLAEADRAFGAGLVSPSETRLSDMIYPVPASDVDVRARQDETLRDTSVAQPALGAVSLAALEVLCQFGVRPDAAAGHSYGELTALCAAGCYDAPSLFALSQLRGRLMAETRAGDPGTMLAVMAPEAEIETVLTEGRVNVVVANRNAPAQAVLSGPTVEIRRAEQLLDRRRLRHVRLPVAAAFHSPLVADATGPFRAALEPIDFATAQLPVFANSTSVEYPRDPQAARDLLAAQLAKPVDFVRQIRNMFETGVRTYVEVGPGHTLTRLVASILDGSPHRAVALDASAGRKSGQADLAVVLAQLAAHGHPVRLVEWDPKPPAPAPAKRGLVVPICGANYVSPKKDSPPVSSPSKPLRRPTEYASSQHPATPMAESRQPDRPAPPPTAAERNGIVPPTDFTRESLAAFQKLQEQTAELHRLFLEQQGEAQKTLQLLLTGGRVSAVPAMPVPVVAAPVTMPIQPPAAPIAAAPVALTNGRTELPPARPQPQIPRPVQPADSITKVLLEVVADKTGYPAEMLGLDMSLDADLGIDSIKRVEILAAMQERLPDAPPVPPDRLGSLRTLGDVIAILDQQTAAMADVTPRPALASSRTGPSAADDRASVLLEVVADKTGYPAEMLGLDMSLDADLGIDSIKRVEILAALQERLPDAPSVPPDRLGSLRTLQDVVDLIAPMGAEKKTNFPVLTPA